MGIARRLRRAIERLIRKRPPGLNEIKARAITLHLKGVKKSDIAKALQVHVSTVHRWVQDFLERGIEALFRKQRKGRKRKIDEKQIDPKELFGKTIKEAQAHIEEKLGVKISYSTVWRITRQRLKIPYGKPYKLDKKRPENAEEILREGLKNVLKEGVKVFFVDESGMYHDPSRVRRLGAQPVRADYPGRKVNVIGCIPLFGGNPCLMVRESGVNSVVFAEFLKVVRARNSGVLVLVLDNASFHKSVYVLSVASQLGVILLFLPPYSPDLNPIELVWKDLKRWVNTHYEFEQALKGIEDTFYHLVSVNEYTKYWANKFASELLSLIHI